MFAAAIETLRRWRAQPVVSVLNVAFLLYGALFVRDIGRFIDGCPRHGPGLAVRAGRRRTHFADRPALGDPESSLRVPAHGRLPATPYAYYQPWVADSPQITAQVLADLQRTRPPVVIFETDKQIEWPFPLPTPAEYGAEVYAFLQQAYEPAAPDDPTLRNVFLRRDLAPALRARLP